MDVSSAPLSPRQSVWPLVLLSVALGIGLTIGGAFAKREEIRNNWSKYRSDPLYMFAAPFFKPENDPRSGFQFATDTFSDAASDALSRVFAAFVDPILQIFSVFTGALDQTVGSMFVMRGMLDKLYSGFRQMVDVFARRYAGVLHQLRMTFTRLNDAMGKTFGVAISSVYAGLSTVYSMLSFMDLLMKIVITILVVLVVMIILLFFVLWPFIPLILSVLGILGAAGLGGAVGGMQDAFGCFDGAALLVLANGDRVAARDIVLGTELGYGAGAVKGLLCFEQAYADTDTYLLHGVQVSGSHIVYDATGVPHFVKNCPEARMLPPARRTVYCFITDNRRIPVQSEVGVLEFADWEELDEDDETALREWHARVHAILNGGFVHYNLPTAVALASEAVVSARSRICVPGGVAAVEIASVHPGMYVCDTAGAPTRVIGVVRVSGKGVAGSHALDEHTRVSAGAWIRRDKHAWDQPSILCFAETEEDDVWYSLFTEAGEYCLSYSSTAAHTHTVGIRDFSDIGIRALSDTYGFVLDTLQKKPHTSVE